MSRLLCRRCFHPAGRDDAGRNLRLGVLILLAALVVFPTAAAADSAAAKIVALCAKDGINNTGSPRCPDEQEVVAYLRTIPFESEAAPPLDLSNRNVMFQPWGQSFAVLLTDDGVRQNVGPVNLRDPSIQTDTIFFLGGYSRSAKFDVFKDALQQHLVLANTLCRSRQTEELIGRYERDASPRAGFFRYTCRNSVHEEIRPNEPYPPITYVPANGEPIYFQCLKTTAATADTACSVHDYTTDRLIAQYRLWTSRLPEWQKYSRFIWDFFDSLRVAGPLPKRPI